MTNIERPRVKTRPSPDNDPIRKEDRKVTIVSASGSIIFERGKDGSVRINISNDAGVSEAITLRGGIRTMETVLRQLRPKSPRAK